MGTRRYMGTQPMRTLSERLKWACEASGLSERGVAKAARLKSWRHVSFLVSGTRTNPELKTLQAIAGALGVSIDWLVNGDEPKPDAEHVRVTAQAAYQAYEAALKAAAAPAVDDDDDSDGGAAPAAE